MTEEAQQSQEVPENTVKEPENPETIVENAENALDNSVKKRGRPAGSKDKAPRKKKIVVVEEDVSECLSHRLCHRRCLSHRRCRQQNHLRQNPRPILLE